MQIGHDSMQGIWHVCAGWACQAEVWAPVSSIEEVPRLVCLLPSGVPQMVCRCNGCSQWQTDGCVFSYSGPGNELLPIDHSCFELVVPGMSGVVAG